MQGVPGVDKSGAVVVEPVNMGKVISVSVIAALGGFLFGYDSSVINGANQAIYAQFEVTSGFLQGFMVSIALLGSAAGAFIGGQLADKIGRRKVMLIAAVMFLVGSVGTAFPIVTAGFMFWRLVGGFGIGLAAVICPMYISEMAPAHLRGRLSSLFQFAIVIGIFATQLVNQIIIHLAPQTIRTDVGNSQVPAQVANNSLALGLEAWQWMFLCMVVPAAIYLILALGVPESPRYLVAEGKPEEAHKVLGMIYQGDTNDKVAAIQESLRGEKKPSMADIKGPTLGLVPLVWVGVAAAIFQQFVGINAVFYYSNLIWAAIGFDESRAFFTSTIISAVNVIFTIVAIMFVDRLGRKPLLMIGSAGMAVTLGLLTWVFTAAQKCSDAIIAAGGQPGCTVEGDLHSPILTNAAGNPTASAWIAVISLNLYVAFFAATWGPVVWVLLGEMFPNRYRAAAMSVAVMSNWLANFVVSSLFPELVSISLGLAYGLFTVCAIASIFFVQKFLKETKGAELEDMDELTAAPRAV